MPGGRRSPTERALRELAAVRREVGHDRALSMDEAIDVAGRISRRDLLKLGGVAGAGLVLAGCERGSSSAPPNVTPTPANAGGDTDAPRIVVVGAGLAGLTTAYRMDQAGVACRVFEARDRIGGRCWSARFPGGQVGEHGGEFVDTRHVHLRVLADELGLELDDLWSAWLPGSTWLNFVDGEIVKRGALFSEMDAAVAELMRVARSGSFFPGEASDRMRAFDEMSEAEWFSENVGPTEGGLYRLWSQGQAGWYGLDPDRLGATNLIDFYGTEWPGADERYTIHDGNDQVPARLVEELPEGTVTLEAALESLRVSGDGGYELRFSGIADPVRADLVVLTLPFTALRRVDLADAGISATKLRAIQELGMGTNAKVLMQFDEPFFTGFGDWSGGMNRGDDPILGTWESGATDGSKTLGLLTVYSGGAVGAGYPVDQPHLPAPQGVVDSTLGAIDEVVPGVSGAFAGEAWLDAWVLDPWVGGSYAAYLPGQTTTFLGETGIAEGGLHFAGEHTSVYSQGYLNGGVESGDRAAAEVLDLLDAPLPEGLTRSQRLARRYRPVYPWE